MISSKFKNAIRSLIGVSIVLVLTSAGCAGLRPQPTRIPATSLVSSDTEVVKPMTAQEFLKYYHLDKLHDQGWKGKGEHIAIVNFGSVTQAQKTAFAQYFQKIGIAPTLNYVTDSSSLGPTSGEFTMDVEMATMVAPEATFDIYSFMASSNPNTPYDFATAFTEILKSDQVKVITMSFLDCEGDPVETSSNISTVSSLLKLAANRGITVLMPTGDQEYACGNYKPGLEGGANKRLWPATSPYVTAMGATSIENLYSKDPTEVGWHFSGGGASKLYPVPSWQKGVLPAEYQGRGIPDLSFFGGDPGFQEWLINDQGQGEWNPKPRGTSLTAPQMAGFIALVNQARAEGRKPAIGYLNPILYSLYSKSPNQFASVIHDITQGDGLGDHQQDKPGWDSVTGLGSPIAEVLFRYLVDYSVSNSP